MGERNPKKLVLNRETVRDLTQDEMAGVDGGYKKGHPWSTDPSLPDCYICLATCGCD